MKKINKQTKFIIAISVVSVLFLVAVAGLSYFMVQNQRNHLALMNANNEISSKDYEYSVNISEKESSFEAFSSERASEVSSYEDKISENSSEYESSLNDLNEKIDQLKQQVSHHIKKPEAIKPVVSKPIKNQVVYLTFDDGPSQYTPEILNILDKYGVKATFFVINSDYKKYMKDIVDRGHAIGLHCNTHKYANVYASDEAYYNDLNAISNVVKEQTGVESKIIRFPGGSSNTVSKKYCKGIMTRISKGVTNKGYVYYDWNCANGDADGVKTVDGALNAVRKSHPMSADRVIVLMHDTRLVTLQSLPKIIEYFKECGCTFDSISTDVKPVHHGINN